MNRVRRSTFVAALFAGLFMLPSGAVLAAGLSPIKVGSAFGQPFVAEIEVTGLQPDDLLTAQTRLASPDEYTVAKLAYQPIVRQIRIALDQTGPGKAMLRLTSTAPIAEPAINLLVEFSWRGGRILQKYPVLLDPPK